LIAAISLFIGAAAIVALAESFSYLCVAAVLVGLGNSVFHPADFTLLNHNVSTKRLGHAFSVHGLSGTIGWALAPAMLATIATVSHWRTAALVAAGVATVPLLIFVIRRASLVVNTEVFAAPKSGHNSDQPPRRMLLDQLNFMASPAVWTSFCFFLVVSIAFGGLQNFAPSVFVGLYDVSAKHGAWLLSAFLLGASVGGIVGGFLVASQRANDRIIAFVLAIAASGLFVVSTAALSVLLCFLLMFGAGFASGLAGPARDMLVRVTAIRQFGAEALGRVYGLVYSGLDVGIAVSPLIFGALLDRQLYGGVLLVVGCFYVIGGIIALTMGRMGTSEEDAALEG
jgi:predicted MFS family arabinose efflux permease